MSKVESAKIHVNMEMEGNCMRARNKRDSAIAIKIINTCTDENNNDTDFSDVNSDPLAQVHVDENEEHL